MHLHRQCQLSTHCGHCEGRNKRHKANMEQTHGDPGVTATGIEFAPWSTVVEEDELWLVRLRYGDSPGRVDFPSEGFSLELPESDSVQIGTLEATFLSREKRGVVVFGFDNVIAFRVLDEHGLVDLWNASARSPRPARTTFRVKGHKWQEESFLSWFTAGCEFSFMIATGWDCLEVVASTEPVIELRAANVVELSHS